MNILQDLPEIAETLGADLVLINGKIITVDQEDSIAEAVAVKYQRIAKVGSNEEIKKLIKPETEVIDLKEKCVTPGFITTHEHFLRYGYNAVSGIDLWYPKMKNRNPDEHIDNQWNHKDEPRKATIIQKPREKRRANPHHSTECIAEPHPSSSLVRWHHLHEQCIVCAGAERYAS